MTYPEIAAELGITLCLGCNNFPHDRGAVSYPTLPGKVHWRIRQVNNVGLYRFLKLAALAEHDELGRRMGWERVHIQNVLVISMARRIHRRLPRHLADFDRAQVRFLLTDVPEYERRSYDERTQRAFKQATRWAYTA